MDVIDSIQSTAASLYSKGKYRDSYNTYIRAANAILVKLASAVQWSGEDVTAKPENISELFRLSHQCITRAEEILKARNIFTAHVPSAIAPTTCSTPQQQPQQNVSHLVAPFPEPLPSIPLSPVTKQQAIHAYQLRVAEHRYASAQRADDTDLNTMRRLVEDVRIQRAKVQDLQTLTESVATVPITHWQPETLALQIAIIDAKLFSKVNIRRDLGGRASQIGSSVRNCLYFNQYVERISISAILSVRPQSSNQDAHSARGHIISWLISVSHHLFYHYRDVNGLCAILRALSSPEIKRLKRTWDTLQSKTKEMLRDLESSIGAGTGHDHLDLITQVLEYHHRGGGVLVAIPFLEPFVNDIEDLHNAYAAGEGMLSEIGARGLEEVLATIELCQGVGRPDPGLGKLGRVAAGIASRSSREAKGKGKDGVDKTAPPDDLSSLGVGNLGLEHWLLTRVYWSRVELWNKSVECEGLKRGEEMPGVYKEVVTGVADIREESALAVAERNIEVALLPAVHNGQGLSFGLEGPEGKTATDNVADNQETGDYLDRFLGDVKESSATKANQETDDVDNLFAMLDELPPVPLTIEERDDDGDGGGGMGEAATNLDASGTLQHPMLKPEDEQIHTSSDEPSTDYMDRYLGPLDETSSVPAPTTTNLQVPSNTDTTETPGFDYMDRYLGSLDEPFPGSNMENDLNATGDGVILTLPGGDQGPGITVEDASNTAAPMPIPSAPSYEDIQAAPICEHQEEQPSDITPPRAEEPEYDGYGLSDLEVDAGDYLDEVVGTPLGEKDEVVGTAEDDEAMEELRKRLGDLR